MEAILEAIKSGKSSMTSTKRERFVRIVERRVNKILNDLDSLGKCSNRKNYEYTSEDVREIFRAIENKVKTIKSLYESSNQTTNQFVLRK